MERETRRITKRTGVPSLDKQIKETLLENQEATAPKTKVYSSSVVSRRNDDPIQSAFELSRIEYAKELANKLKFMYTYDKKTINLIEMAIIKSNVNLTDYLKSYDLSENYYYTAYVVYNLYIKELFTDEELKEFGTLTFTNPIDADRFIKEQIELKESEEIDE